MLKYILPVSELMLGGSPIQDTKEIVNSLIAESFGRNFRGDYGWHIHGKPRRIGKLNEIRKTGLFGKISDCIGIFEEEDGSSVKVHQDHYVSALKYASLYREAMGRPATVKLF